MKTMIAIPCMDQVPTQFCMSLAMLQTSGDCKLVMSPGSLIYTSRNNLATQALQEEYDYVFWLDSDMTFAPDTLIRMMDTLQKRDLDFLTGLYFRRVPPFSPVLFDRLEIKMHDVCSWSNFETIPDDIFEIGGCGFGCVLMKTDMFIDVQSQFNNMFSPIGNNGEDVAFCWRARQCGYKLYCDPSVICGHVGHTVINDQFYRAYKNNGG